MVESQEVGLRLSQEEAVTNPTTPPEVAALGRARHRFVLHGINADPQVKMLMDYAVKVCDEELARARKEAAERKPAPEVRGEAKLVPAKDHAIAEARLTLRTVEQEASRALQAIDNILNGAQPE